MSKIKVTSSFRKSSVKNKTNLISIDNHNDRNIDTGNSDYLESAINFELTKNNVILIGDNTPLVESFKKYYNSYFAEEIEKYNSLQKRKDRKIEDYFEQVNNSKKQGLGSEIILQFGDSDFWEEVNKKVGESRKNIVAKEIAENQIKTLEKLLPNYQIVKATLHLDETSPHLHIVGFNVVENCKRGLKKQAVSSIVGNKTELYQMHSQFKKESFLEVQKILEREKIDIKIVEKEKGEPRKHLEISEFKEISKNFEKINKDISEKLKSIEGKKAEKNFFGKVKYNFEYEEFEKIKKNLEDLRENFERQQMSEKYLESLKNYEILKKDNDKLISENKILKKEIEDFQISKEREFSKYNDEKIQIVENIDKLREENDITRKFVIDNQAFLRQQNELLILEKKLKEKKELEHRLMEFERNMERLEREQQEKKDLILRLSEEVQTKQEELSEVNEKYKEVKFLDEKIEDLEEKREKLSFALDKEIEDKIKNLEMLRTQRFWEEVELINPGFKSDVLKKNYLEKVKEFSIQKNMHRIDLDKYFLAFLKNDKEEKMRVFSICTEGSILTKTAKFIEFEKSYEEKFEKLKNSNVIPKKKKIDRGMER